MPGSTTETETINLDFDSGGKLVGIEIWAASTVLREETLNSVKPSY